MAKHTKKQKSQIEIEEEREEGIPEAAPEAPKVEAAPANEPIADPPGTKGPDTPYPYPAKAKAEKKPHVPTLQEINAHSQKVAAEQAASAEEEFKKELVSLCNRYKMPVPAGYGISGVVAHVVR